MTGPTDPRQPVGSHSMGAGGPQRPRKRGGWVRDALPAILGLLLLVGLGIGALLLGDDGGDEPKRSAATSTQTSTTETATTQTAAAAPATTAETPDAAKPKPRKREVRLPLKRIPGGLPGRAVVTVRRTSPGHGTLTVAARVPRSKLEVHLVKRRGPSKVLATAIAGPMTVTRQIPLSTFRRYSSIDVLARRLPARRGKGRVRSLRVRSDQITRRLAQQG